MVLKFVIVILLLFVVCNFEIMVIVLEGEKVLKFLIVILLCFMWSKGCDWIVYRFSSVDCVRLGSVYGVLLGSV